jgi:phytoene synthase
VSGAARDPVASLVREHAFGRYAATLFAPAPARPHLLALHAFGIEIGRVRDLVSEPMPGELRLQWWRDALENPERADAVSHPVARALEGAIAYGRLPREALLRMIDARTDDLYDDPVATLSELESRLGATHSAALRLACLVAAAGREPGGAEACGFGGVAEGLARLIADLPRHAARRQVLLPVDRMAANGAARADVEAGRPTPALRAVVDELAAHAARRLDDARGAFASLDPAAAVALLPLALVAPELKRLAARGASFEASPEPARWRTLARLWRASRGRPPF